jgi:serine O-acetyltransferase
MGMADNEYPTTLHECWYHIRADVYRARGDARLTDVIRQFLVSPNSRLLVVLRIGAYARATKSGMAVLKLVTSLAYRRLSSRCAVEIPFRTVVGPGLAIRHRVGGIVVNPMAQLGEAVTLLPGVVIGGNRFDEGPAVIGDHVMLSVGAKVIGSVSVGPGSTIGANAIVVHDVPAGSVVVGVPGRCIDSGRPVPSKHTDFRTALGGLPG